MARPTVPLHLDHYSSLYVEFRTFSGVGAEQDGGIVAPLRGVGENIEKDVGHFSGERVSRTA